MNSDQRDFRGGNAKDRPWLGIDLNREKADVSSKRERASADGQSLEDTERATVITGVFLYVPICWVWCHMYIAFVLQKVEAGRW